MRLHGDLCLLKPVNGKSASKAGERYWTEEFEFSEGRSTKDSGRDNGLSGLKNADHAS
jgi:hypothetical protein